MRATLTRTASLGEAPRASSQAVAEILADGTIRELDRAPAVPNRSRMAGGTLSGEGWTIWWERRLYVEAPR